MNFFIHLVLLAASAVVATPSQWPLPESVETRFFNQTLDHYNWADPTRFSQRYLVDEQYFTTTAAEGLSANCPGPLLVYSAGEGEVDMFYHFAGFVHTTLAAELHAKVLFVEHRFYGESIPANATRDVSGRLMIEQALGDLAAIVKEENPHACPAFVFGGSYGGTLAALARWMYPNVFYGALSSSGTFLHYAGVPEYDPYSASDIIEANMEFYGCSEALETFFAMPPNDSATIQAITDGFDLCGELTDVSELMGWVYGMLFNAGQNNNPPEFPLQRICDIINNDTDPESTLSARVFQAYNSYQNTSHCFMGGTDGLPGPPHLDTYGQMDWRIQMCSEVFYQLSTRPDGIFGALRAETIPSMIERCRKDFLTVVGEEPPEPRPFWIATSLLNPLRQRVEASSRVIYAVGQFDPWAGSCITPDLVEFAQESVYIYIEGGAHHSDFRLETEADTEGVRAARRIETQMFKKWARQWSERFGD